MNRPFPRVQQWLPLGLKEDEAQGRKRPPTHTPSLPLLGSLLGYLVCIHTGGGSVDSSVQASEHIPTITPPPAPCSGFTYICCSTMALTIPIISRKFHLALNQGFNIVPPQKHLSGTCVATLITNICSNPAPIRESLLQQTFITMGLMTHFTGSLCTGK